MAVNAPTPESHEQDAWAVCGWNLIHRVKDYDPLPAHLADKITTGAIEDASNTIYRTGKVLKTPIIDGTVVRESTNSRFSLGLSKSFGIKLESMQPTGSFKIRGATYQFSKIGDVKDKELITISAGNYGRSFSFLAKEMDAAAKATVFMPATVNESRRKKIRATGVKVDCTFEQDKLVEGVMKYKEENGAIYLHPFDDPDILIGHGSAGLELLEQVPTVDIVLVCCGGGGFVAGITAAIRLSGNSHTKVYAVEHEMASTMFDSLKENKIVKLKNNPSCTICPGLAAPFPGDVPFEVFRALGDGVILITEEEIKRAVDLLYRKGLVVEPSGAAAVAAVLSNKVPDAAGKNVVSFITGANVTPLELDEILIPERIQTEVESEPLPIQSVATPINFPHSFPSFPAVLNTASNTPKSAPLFGSSKPAKR